MIELTLDMAERVAKAALAKARQLGTVMTASVVDEAGRTVLIMRGDRAGCFRPREGKWVGRVVRTLRLLHAPPPP